MCVCVCVCVNGQWSSYWVVELKVFTGPLSGTLKPPLLSVSLHGGRGLNSVLVFASLLLYLRCALNKLRNANTCKKPSFMMSSWFNKCLYALRILNIECVYLGCTTRKKPNLFGQPKSCRCILVAVCCVLQQFKSVML